MCNSELSKAAKKPAMQLTFCAEVNSVNFQNKLEKLFMVLYIESTNANPHQGCTSFITAEGKF